jgi:hypothetical protein
VIGGEHPSARQQRPAASGHAGADRDQSEPPLCANANEITSDDLRPDSRTGALRLRSFDPERELSLLLRCLLLRVSFKPA